MFIEDYVEVFWLIGLADACLTLDIRIKSSDGSVLPVISSVSNEIGPEGGRVEFQLADVILDVPQSALSSAVTFSVKAYVDPACFPPVTLKDEVLLSPVFHLFSSLPHDHHFKKPLQLQLPLEVPLRSSDRDSGRLVQLKRSESSDSLPSEWLTVLELNTETGEVMSQSFLQFDYSSGTLHLDQFSCFAWLGKPFRAIRGKLGFSPVRKINYAVFGKQVQNHKWCIAIHIIHGSKVIYESLVNNLKEKGYVELTDPKNDCIQSGGKVSVCIQCLEPWQVRLGKKDVQINTNQIWRSGQHSSCYHEVTVEDISLKTDVLECTIEASFQAKGNRNAGDSVELVVSQPLQSNKLEAGAADYSPHRNPDSESKCSSTPGEEIVYVICLQCREHKENGIDDVPMIQNTEGQLQVCWCTSGFVACTYWICLLL